MSPVPVSSAHQHTTPNPTALSTHQLLGLVHRRRLGVLLGSAQSDLRHAPPKVQRAAALAGGVPLRQV